MNKTSYLSFSSPSGQFNARIESRQLAFLLAQCSNDPTLETGRILIGHYNAELTIVLATQASASPPDSYKDECNFGEMPTISRDYLIVLGEKENTILANGTIIRKELTDTVSLYGQHQ